MADRLSQLQDMVNQVKMNDRINLKATNLPFLFTQQAENLCNSIGKQT